MIRCFEARSFHNHGLRALVVAALGIGCSPSATRSDAGAGIDALPQTDAGGVDAGESDTNDLTACRVRLEDAMNPCAPTAAEQEARQAGTDFGEVFICASTFFSYQSIEATRRRDCIYGPGATLIAWDIVEDTRRFCDGRARAIVGDAYSRYQLTSCLPVDLDWTWIQSFDPGPPTISIQLGADLMSSGETILETLAFVLGGSEIAASDLTLRYWYTADAGSGTVLSQSVGCDGSQAVSCDSTTISLIPVTPPRPMADTYAEIRFPNDHGILSTGATSWVEFHIIRNDGGAYNRVNDYSNDRPPNGMPTSRVTAYVKGALIYGTEP